MTEELKEIGLDVGHRRVGRLMRQNGISVVRTRKHKVTKDSNHKFNIAPNLLDRDFVVDAPNQKDDISYVWPREGWLYLAVILDRYQDPPQLPCPSTHSSQQTERPPAQILSKILVASSCRFPFNSRKPLHSSEAGSSCRRSSVVSFRLVASNPTLPENTSGCETRLHHALGHDPEHTKACTHNQRYQR